MRKAKPLEVVGRTGDLLDDAALEEAAVKLAYGNLQASSISEPDFWLCLVFEDGEQAKVFKQFLEATEDDQYLNGVKVARKLGCPLPPAGVKFSIVPTDPELEKISLEMGGDDDVQDQDQEDS